MEKFVLTIDGVDCEMNEIQHPKFNIDKNVCSVKKKHAAAKYELGITVHHARCCYMNGPYKGGVHDLEMFRQGPVKEKLQELAKMGKKAIVDRGYHTN
jgi:hypothetical protein